MRSITVANIGEKLGIQVVGDGSALISRIRPLDDAAEGDLTFLWASAKKEKSRLLTLARSSRASAILTSAADNEISATQLLTPNPIGTIIRIVELMGLTDKPAAGIHPSAVIAPSAKLGADISVGPFCVVGEDVEIGPNTVLHPHVVIYRGAKIGADCVIHSSAVVREHVVLGDNCLLQNGVVLGGDGFGYIPTPTGPERIPHVGTLIVEDSVDFGANSTADRATFGETRIGKFTKVDNLVLIAHNVKIGKRAFLCGQVGVSGSTTIGDDCILAGQVGVADHITIGNGAQIAGGAGVISNVPDGARWGGHPAQPVRDWLRAEVRKMRAARSTSRSDTPK